MLVCVSEIDPIEVERFMRQVYARPLQTGQGVKTSGGAR